MNQITFQNAYQTSLAASFQIGQQAQTPDGNIWIYVQATTGVLAKGSIAIPDTVTAVDLVSSSTNNLGQIVYLTKASAGWTNGAFAGDYVVVDDGTGVGQASRIMDNTADTLYLYTPFTTALSVSDSDITIFKPWHVTKSAVTSKLQNAVGIAQNVFANLEFGWVLQRGIGSVLAGIALSPAGVDFTTGDDTTGQATIGIATNGQFDAQSLGRSLVANAAADQLCSVFVDIV